MFRRYPGRLLNVLCKFNLRPVSTGYSAVYFFYDLSVYYGKCRLVGNMKIVYQQMFSWQSSASFEVYALICLPTHFFYRYNILNSCQDNYFIDILKITFKYEAVRSISIPYISLCLLLLSLFPFMFTTN